MSIQLSQYHARHPRYILLPMDNTFIRVSGPKNQAWEESTEIQNVSKSGMAFTAPTDLSPILGELIKIQFEVPGSSQMACHALVSRIEPYKKGFLKIGIQFHDLSWPQNFVLTKGLFRKTNTVTKKQNLKSSTKDLIEKWPQALLMLGSLGIWATVFYARTLSSWLPESADLFLALFNHLF